MKTKILHLYQPVFKRKMMATLFMHSSFACKLPEANQTKNQPLDQFNDAEKRYETSSKL